MTSTLSKRLGKLLFPHLPRDRRRSRLAIVALVLLVSLMGAGILAILMLRTGKF